jgi:GNAT superfamily N-acetyltransferase
MELAIKLDPDKADIDVVLNGLVAANRKAAGRNLGWQPVAIHLLDPDTGEPVGGLTGETLLDWLFVDLIHVPEELRGQGHGTALMREAERFARERGCVGVWLDTFSFQARPFYEKLGYTVFGTIEGHPVGGQRYFLQRRLA